MFNVLLDSDFPVEYEGYKLNTDFRIGIMLTLLQDDETVPEDLKLLKAFDLLYKEKVPPYDIALKGLLWFLSCGKSETHTEDEEKEQDITDKAIDFNVDSLDIWGAFWAKGIDLTKINMHWFKFMTAIGYLGECPLTHKMAYRTTDLSKLKGDTRKYYAELKEKYRIKKIYTDEEYNEIIERKKEKYGNYYARLMQGKL